MKTRVSEEIGNDSAAGVWGWRVFRVLEDRKGPVLLLIAVCSAFIAYFRLALRMNIVCTHFVYVPIVLTGMWWGRKSMLVAVLFGAFILCLRPFVSASEPFAADLARAFFFVLVAFCVGTVSEMAEAARRAERESRRELVAAQRQLVASERLASMGQLSAALAHEVNNPLGTILIYSHMMLKQMQDGDPRREDIQMIVNEATRSKEIVHGLLDFARQSRVARTPTKLKDVIDDAMLIMEPKAKAAGIHLENQVENGLPAIMIDGNQIRQVLVNLVQNSIDATEAEEGAVRISARLSERSGGVDIAVSDTGCGIAPETLSELFTPFFTTKETGKGTGLGLAIAYGIVKMHYGDIHVESEPGKGTTFSIWLPIGLEDQAKEESVRGLSYIQRAS
jgi:signal transduction histidine kinase